MAGLSSVQRTIAYLKDLGILCGVVEKWIPNKALPGGGIRKDFLNIIDIIAISKADGILGIQVCGSDFSAHVKKITEDKADETAAWLDAGGRLQIIGWRKVKKVRGGKLMVWKPRIIEITTKHLK
jgi:hypothetical protein